MKTGKFDVVIIDRAMPGMGGDELAGVIKELSQETAVMMLTGFGDIMIEEGEMPANVDVIVPKPVTMRELHLGLMEAMGSKKAKPVRPSREKSVRKEAPTMMRSREPTRRPGPGPDGHTCEGEAFKWID